MSPLILEQSEERKQAIVRYLAQHPEAGRYEISKALQVPPATVGRLLRKIRAGEKPKAPTSWLPMPESANGVPEAGARNLPDGCCELVTENPCTLDDLLAACRVDLSVWRVARHVVNKWEVGAKQDDGSVVRTPLFQIKAWLERIPGADDAKVVRETIEWIREHSPVARVARPVGIRTLTTEDEHLLEMSVVDLHIGKLCWAPETGDNYDTEIAASLHQQAIENLWPKASVFAITKIILLVGNDFYNVNGASNATAAGTPQSEDDRWPKTFRRGVAVLSRAIEYLRGRVRDGVEVRVIRGNHDSERIFSAGEVLAAMYQNVDDVTIVNDPIKRQYIRWGNVLLGWTHGDGAKLEKLPLLMAGECGKQGAPWDGATHREIHCGHFHHKKETHYHVGAESSAVRVRVLPSLTAADEWHYLNGFVGSLRAAEAYIWAKKAGYVGHLSWSPLAEQLAA